MVQDHPAVRQLVLEVIAQLVSRRRKTMHYNKWLRKTSQRQSQKVCQSHLSIFSMMLNWYQLIPILEQKWAN
ncbi:hypothetical protein FGO68_gene6790 [Halteria grandinella]|uniref:Uncharacterized protein n=1 Tax=Halteria grandinella TaxID=5974 RepID=A0A8J8N9R7_HALGN|nr:hypothetical protein FGO68_gene6790 [Halteria grandinella]